MDKFGETFTEEDIEDILANAKIDENGEIDYEEFISLLMK